MFSARYRARFLPCQRSSDRIQHGIRIRHGLRSLSLANTAELPEIHTAPILRIRNALYLINIVTGCRFQLVAEHIIR